MPSNMHRRHTVKKQNAARRPTAISDATRTTWADLRRLGTDEVRALAQAMGIAYTTRTKTLSAIHKLGSI